jgi:hypothetical protein
VRLLIAPEPQSVYTAWQVACASRSIEELAAFWIADSAVTFAPFDRPDILSGRDAIVAHLSQRAIGWTSVDLALTAVASWRDDGQIITVAHEQLRFQPLHGKPEARDLILMASAIATPGGVRFVNVAESVSALLPLVIASYRVHAVEAWA